MSRILAQCMPCHAACVLSIPAIGGVPRLGNRPGPREGGEKREEEEHVEQIVEQSHPHTNNHVMLLSMQYREMRKRRGNGVVVDSSLG